MVIRIQLRLHNAALAIETVLIPMALAAFTFALFGNRKFWFITAIVITALARLIGNSAAKQLQRCPQKSGIPNSISLSFLEEKQLLGRG